MLWYHKLVVRWRAFLLTDYMKSNVTLNTSEIKATIELGFSHFQLTREMLQRLRLNLIEKKHRQKITIVTYSPNAETYLKQLEALERTIRVDNGIREDDKPSRDHRRTYTLHQWLRTEDDKLMDVETFVNECTTLLGKIANSVDNGEEASASYLRRVFLPTTLDTPRVAMALKELMWEQK